MEGILLYIMTRAYCTFKTPYKAQFPPQPKARDFLIKKYEMFNKLMWAIIVMQESCVSAYGALYQYLKEGIVISALRLVMRKAELQGGRH